MQEDSFDEREKEAIKKMTSSFLEIVSPPIEKIEMEYDKVIENQNDLIEIGKEGKLDYKTRENFKEISKSFKKIPKYLEKIKTIKKRKKVTEEKLKKLKKRIGQLN